MMIRWSCGFRAEKVMNSRTRSFALVISSTPRSPAVRSSIVWFSTSKSESTAACHSSSFERKW